MTNDELLNRFRTGRGFVAALDQSGGSTPKALAAYGIDPSGYQSESEMFDLIHSARTRVITSPAFTSDRVLGAILFAGTLERQIEGRSVVDYLWQTKSILPFLKIDVGLEETSDGVQVMRDIPDVDQVLADAAERGIFGTKERSVIHEANPVGVARIVTQQFDLAEQVLAAGLVPILEPEVDINAPDKADAEVLLKIALLERLESMPGDGSVGIKISIPSVDDFYTDLIDHPRVARVVALSGGYSRDEADERLARNHGLIASFSRALLDGLSVSQTDEEFNATLEASSAAIYRASIT